MHRISSDVSGASTAGVGRGVSSAGLDMCAATSNVPSGKDTPPESHCIHSRYHRYITDVSGTVLDVLMAKMSAVIPSRYCRQKNDDGARIASLQSLSGTSRPPPSIRSILFPAKCPSDHKSSCDTVSDPRACDTSSYLHQLIHLKSWDLLQRCLAVWSVAKSNPRALALRLINSEKCNNSSHTKDHFIRN